MKIGITFKPKITVALLLIVIVMNAFSMFILFPRVENIINVDLYEYGLKFSPEWFNPINDSSNLFVDSLGISLMLMIVAALTVMVYNRKRSAFTKAVSILLIAAGAGINLFSLYQFYLIDQIVNGKLYYYGLLIDGGWFANYKLYSLQLTGFVGFAIATAAVSIALIALSTRKSIDLVPESLANSILIISGTTFLALSILYTSSILAFLGLGMLFWGVIFTYVSNEEYVKKILLDTSTSSQMATANKVIQETDFAGNAVFLPPRYFKVAEQSLHTKKQDFKLPNPRSFLQKGPPLVC